MYTFGMGYLWPFYLIGDCYWCFIPLKCRYCKWLTVCRKPFWQGRKCYHGCVELNILRQQRREREREDYLEALVEYTEQRFSLKGEKY